MGIFKDCDIRGKYPGELDEDVALRFGKAFGTFFSGKRVLVGGDIRTHTPKLKSSMIKGLIFSGCKVLDLGICPIPIFYYFYSKFKCAGGIMVTASHNPGEFNGFKVVMGNIPVTTRQILEIKKVYDGGDFERIRGGITKEVGSVNEYFDYIRSFYKNKYDFNVCIDCSNGCYSEIAPDFLSDYGIKLTDLNCRADGNFPGHVPNPAVEENLLQLKECVKNNKADFGVAFDCDGDRVAFVDDRARVVSGDKCFLIIAHYLTKQKKEKFVFETKSSSIVEEGILGLKGIPIQEKTGHTHIKARVIKENALLGAEISGHYFYRSLNGGDDGLFTTLLMCEILSSKGRRLSELADEIKEYCTTPDIRIPFDEADAKRVLSELKDDLKDFNLVTVDGVKVIFDEGWGLCRVSISEPLISLRFETKKKSDLGKVIRRFLRSQPELLKEVKSRLEVFGMKI
ncbi:MAG: phosphomannomutase/phosphoglucomutase [Actinobacteria bacterium]|nr:phosphomannomutase/phosphoglucomutase [Actinomycetota bacterium]